MAIGLSLSSTSSLQSMSAIIIAPAIENTPLAGPTNELVVNYPIKSGTYQVNLPLWNRLSAAQLVEGVDLSSPEQLAVTVRNLTAVEHGILSFVSNRLIKQNNEAILAEVGEMQGNATGRLLESDLVTLFDSVTGLSVPGAGDQLTYRMLAGYQAYLKTDNNSSFGPAPGKVNAVLHPEQLRRLVEEGAGMQAGGSVGMPAVPIPKGMSEEIVENYFRGTEMRMGMRLWESGVISRDGSGDSKGCAFVEKAFALAIEQEVEAKDFDDISLRGLEIVTVMVWGESEVVDEWAVEAYSASDVIA